MNEILRVINDLLNLKIVQSIIVIIINIIIYNIVASILNDKNHKSKLFSSSRGKTYIKMIKSIIRYIMIGITFLIILKIHGINVGSMLAGVGIVGIIIGFAIQDLLKDIIKGFDILSDQYFQVGDVIKYQDIEAKVIAIGLKCTKAKDVKTFNIISISNRNIDQVEVVSDMINIDIPLPYELKIKEAEKVIDDIIKNINKLEDVKKCEYRGVNELDTSSINYNIKVYTQPDKKVQVRRDAIREIVLTLEKHNIQVPYQQIDIHERKEVK